MGLASTESCIRDHENNLARFDRYNTEDILEIVKLYEKLNVNNFVVTKQRKFKKDQIKEKMKDSLIRKYIVNSLMRKKNLTGTNLGNG